MRDLPWPLFLDSGRPMVAQGRYDIIAAAPFRTLTSRGGITELAGTGPPVHSRDDPFELLRRELAVDARPPQPGLPFSGGAIGYLSYDLARRIERLPDQARADAPLPELAVGLYDWALVVDHAAQACHLVSQGHDPSSSSLWDRLVERFTDPPTSPARPWRLTEPFRSNLERADYLRGFERIQRYIHDGDCYQVNYAQRFQAGVSGDSWTAYRRLRQVNPAPFGAYLETPAGEILSSSPERFLRLDQDHVLTSPIKGTRPRRADPEADRRQRAQLLASPKEQAENLMIVDLLRNDLGRVCRPGSIQVSRLFEVESFARVHHLVSTIEGDLAPGEDALSLLRACFPGGSITGAPKLRAMQIIEELEGYRRGVYCGAIGYIGWDGRMDTNIAIRTLVRQGKRLQFWAGGGIVADSQGPQEYQETLDKASAILAALQG